MNFKELIKQEWEAEFPEAKGLYETCIFNMCYSSLVEKICVKVWNSALELAANTAETDTELDEYDGQAFDNYIVDKHSILKHKISIPPEVNSITLVINEQRTNTPEV